MQSLVPSLTPNNLILFTIYFSFLYLSFDKNRTPPDWKKEDPSGLAEIGPFSDWQNWDPSGLAKLGPLRIGKNRTPPDWQNWDPSGLAKFGHLRIGKNRTLRIGKIGTAPDWQNCFSETFKTFTLYHSGYVLRCCYAVGPY